MRITRRAGGVGLLGIMLALLTACGRDPGLATPSATAAPNAPTATFSASAPTATPAGSPAPNASPGWDTSQVPPAPAAHGLAQTPLPNTQADVETLLAHMPADLDGHARQANTPAPGPGAYQLVYGDPTRPDVIRLTIVPISVEDYLAPFGTAGGYIAYNLSLPQYDGSPKPGGHDGTLFWVGSTIVTPASGAAQPQPGQPVPTPGPNDQVTYSMLWGTETGGWLFGATAGSPQVLDDLVNIFTQVANATF
jgi:hypothetical protein